MNHSQIILLHCNANTIHDKDACRDIKHRSYKNTQCTMQMSVYSSNKETHVWYNFILNVYVNISFCFISGHGICSAEPAVDVRTNKTNWKKISKLIFENVHLNIPLIFIVIIDMSECVRMWV